MLMSLPTLFAAARSVDPFEATREIQPPTISAPDATRADDRYVLSAGSSSTAYAALLKGNTPATLESCVDAFPAEYRAACVSQFDETKQVNIEQLASACTWVPHEDVVMSAHGPPPYIDLEHDDTVSYERCVQSTPTGEVWELARVGPWTTTGGIDWNSVLSSSYACDLHDFVGGGFDIPIEKQKLPGMANQMSTRCNVALRPPDLPFFEDQFAWTRGGTADGHLVVAISEYMLGAISPSGRLLGYPPIHAHHLHIEEGRPASDTGPSPPGSPPDWLASAYGALVAHGDEQCLEGSNGVGCLIKRAVPGYATMLRLPLAITVDQQDVRANGSAPLRWYTFLALKGRPRDGSRKAVTQMKLMFYPLQYNNSVFGTFLVPSAASTAFWREGRFLVNASSVLWSYVHTHPAWMSEMWMYVGASSQQMRVGEVLTGNISLTQYITEYSGAELEAARAVLEANAKRADATLVCHYRRDSSMFEVGEPETAELDNHFYRKPMGCVPFRITAGLPFVGIVVTSPSSKAAARANTDMRHLKGSYYGSGEHAFFRLFVNLEETLEGYDYATCEPTLTTHRCYDFLPQDDFTGSAGSH